METLHSDILSDFEDELNQYRYTNPKQCSFQIFSPKNTNNDEAFSVHLKPFDRPLWASWTVYFEPFGLPMTANFQFLGTSTYILQDHFRPFEPSTFSLFDSPFLFLWTIFALWTVHFFRYLLSANFQILRAVHFHSSRPFSLDLFRPSMFLIRGRLLWTFRTIHFEPVGPSTFSFFII